MRWEIPVLKTSLAKKKSKGERGPLSNPSTTRKKLANFPLILKESIANERITCPLYKVLIKTELL